MGGERVREGGGEVGGDRGTSFEGGVGWGEEGGFVVELSVTCEIVGLGEVVERSCLTGLGEAQGEALFE